jgi:hypothetical protein
MVDMNQGTVGAVAHHGDGQVDGGVGEPQMQHRFDHTALVHLQR